MARKSAAALSIVAGTIDGRPKPPDDLNPFQAEVWERTVANEAADMFRTAATQQLLKEYCRHVDTASRLTRMIETATMEGSNLTLQEMDTLLRMRDRETKALGYKATQLRITNQSRYTTKAAATAAKHAQERKPWHAVG